VAALEIFYDKVQYPSIMTGQFVAGIVGAPFGLEGFVKLKPLSGETGHLLKLKSAALRLDGKERLLDIEKIVSIPPALAVRFAGIAGPEGAKTLRGAELLLSREEAAPLQPGEFYVEDLKGLEVYAGEDVLGHIVSIFEGGGGDLAEICLNGGKTRLVPFRKEFFSDINTEKGRVTLQNLWILE
jgi:16S rRNA processing protein RimM